MNDEIRNLKLEQSIMLVKAGDKVLLSLVAWK